MSLIKKILNLSIFLIIINLSNAQSSKVLKGNLPLPSLLLPDDNISDWENNRVKIQKRILTSWGVGPIELTSKNEFHIYKSFEINGLKVIEYRYQVYGNHFDQGYLVLPKNFNSQKKYKCFVAIHGSNKSLGGYQTIDTTNAPNRAYAFDMATKGYIAFAPSLFDFGDTLLTTSQDSIRNNLIKQYPDWTIVGRQMYGLKRSLDMLDQLPFIKTSSYILMGHSLGGRNALYLAALDKRIKATVISAGVSPSHSNIYRGLKRNASFQPKFWNDVKNNGRYPWEVNEMIALVAPNPLLFIEPYNDPSNPFTGHTVQAFNSSQEVWRLYNTESDFSVYLHGDGHDTQPYIKRFAYNWLIERDN